MSVGQPDIETEYSLDDGSEYRRTEFDEEFDVPEFDSEEIVHTEPSSCSCEGTVPFCC